MNKATWLGTETNHDSRGGIGVVEMHRFFKVQDYSRVELSLLLNVN